MTKRKNWLSLVILTMALGWNSPAQTTGVIEGTVFDPNDLPVTASQVQLIETATNATRELQTNGQGQFTARLAPGDYRVQASLQGFRTVVQDGVRLSAGRTVSLRFHLPIGELSEKIMVEATPPIVSTSASDWGGTIDERQLRELPLNGRDMFDLAAQMPGANIALHKRGALFSGAGIQVSVNGNRPNQNSFRLDGVYMNDAASSAPASAVGRLLGIEAIEELRLITNPFSAEYGKAAGSVFTAVSRSGSNDWHGSLFTYFRDDALDARNFFDSPAQDKPPLRRNQFGGSFGGPVVEDKIFFMATYEGIRENLSRTQQAATLTQDARKGILPDGVVPVDPSIPPYLDLYPLPNGTDFGDGSAEFISEAGTTNREDFGSIRGDFLLSDRVQTSARLTMDDANNSFPDEFLLWKLYSDSRFMFLNSNTQYVQSPATLHVFRFGFSRVHNGEDSEPPDVPSSLSFVPGRPLGMLRVTGLTRVSGAAVGPRHRIHKLDDVQFNYDVSHVRGSHTLRFGAGYDYIRFRQVGDFNANGAYDFRSIENFLGANARRGDLMTPQSDSRRDWRQHQYYFFAQDEFRPVRRLSLTLGVRYEGYSTPDEANGKIATLPDPLHDTRMTVGGPLFDNPSATNFAPRAALAWDVFGTGRTVVRAGAGMFFDLLTSRELTIAGMRVPPFFNRLFVTAPEFPDLVKAAEDGAPSDSIDGTAYNVEQPYVLQYRFAIEQQIGSQTAVEIGYAGSRGAHLYGQYGDINIAQPERLADGRLFFPEGAPARNPALGRIGTRGTDFNSFYHSLTARLHRRFAHGVRFQASYTWGKVIDESSSATLADFGNSDRNPHPLNIRLQRALGDFDIRHAFNADAGWQIPGPVDGWGKHIAGGWEIHGMLQMQTGFPFNPRTGFDRTQLNSDFGDLNQRPSLAGGSANDIVLGDPQMYFDPTAFALPEAGFYGNLGRNVLRGPALFALNLALHKSIWRNERHDVRFRAEAFNVTNHPNFNTPSSLNLFSSSGGRIGSAGRITSTSTTSRQIQLAVRWTF